MSEKRKFTGRPATNTNIEDVSNLLNKRAKILGNLYGSNGKYFIDDGTGMIKISFNQINGKNVPKFIGKLIRVTGIVKDNNGKGFQIEQPLLKKDQPNGEICKVMPGLNLELYKKVQKIKIRINGD